MLKSTATIALDDDILDLTEVVEQGRTPAAAPAATKAMDLPDGDFGADLDSLLDSLAAASPSAEQAKHPAPLAAPIDNPPPSDHVVDPNEELGEPETADIDSLLAELDVPPQNTAPVAASGKKDWDDSQKIDLNELDSLLDDILATAPPLEKNVQEAAPEAAADNIAPPSPRIAVAESKAPLAAPTPTGQPSPSSAPSSPAPEAPLPAPKPSLPAKPPQVPAQPAPAALPTRIAALEQKIAAMKAEQRSMLAMQKNLRSSIPAKEVEQIVRRALAPGSPLLQQITASIREALFDGPAMEKRIAAAAAKVIREELLPLMADDEK